MKKIWIFLGCFLVPVLLGCDLQPKIMSLPDSVGDFISQRYPALLADPDAQPEIYNSAASDYGVYASPELYGAMTADDYVLYSSVSDYIIPPQPDATPVTVTPGADVGVADVPVSDDIIVVNDNVDASPDVPTDDYLMVPMYGTLVSDSVDKDASEVIVAKGDTLYSLARRYNTTTAELARMNKLDAPYTLRVGQALRLPPPVATYVATSVKEPVASAKEVVKPVENKSVATDTVVIKNPQPTTTKVQLQEITVGQGDTLYSISRKYSVPVNDLAVMNDISAPFGLHVGQRLKVPNLASDTVRVATKVNTPATSVPNASSSSIVVQPTKTVAKATTTAASAPNVATSVSKTATNTSKTTAAKTTQKDTSKTAAKSNNAKKSTDTKTASQKTTKSNASASKQPVIMARSSSKFSWPVRGRVLSGYGAKSSGLFNDGINISATRGTTVSAAENGVVAYAGNEVKGMGNLVIIQHSDGWMTVYAHLDSMSVRRGTNVRVGQKIGTVGSTGKVDKPQLHFEIRKGTKAYNPTTHLKK